MRGRVLPRADRRTDYPWIQYPVLLQREAIEHAPGQQYDMECDMERNPDCNNDGPETIAADAAPMSGPKAAYANGANLLSRPNASRVRCYYTLFLYVATAHLMPNYTNLMHYRTDTKENVLRATAHTFFLQAMSNVGLTLTKEQCNSSKSLKPGYFMVNGKPHRRMRAFIDTIVAAETLHEWDKQSSLLARDVAPGEDASSASAVDAFAMHEINRPRNVAGYLYRIEIFDPSLHPGALICYQLIQNGVYRGLYSMDIAEMRLRGFSKTTFKR